MGAGGAERVAANMANHWAEKGWDVVIVTLVVQSHDVYPLHPAMRRIVLGKAGESGNPVVGLARNVGRVIALRRVLRRVSPDIALGMMTTANVLVALAALGLRVRAVGSEHIHPPCFPLGRLWEALRWWGYGLLNAVTALTAETAQWLEEHTRARRVAVIPNAIPWPIPSGEHWVDPSDCLAQGRKLLLAVGRLDPQKGFDLLIETFSRIAVNHPEWDLAILGEGGEREALECLMQAHSLEGRVSLPGWVGNVAQWYEAASLYVMSSRFEGFGNTLAEAMACGLSAVSFDCDSGPRHIIRHEVDGLLVPPEDVFSLAAALSRLMGDEDLRRRFASRAVEARQQFSLEGIAVRWETLFEAVLTK